MTRIMAAVVCAAFAGAVAAGSAFAAGPRETVEQGKALFEQQKYADAYEKFHAASADVPSSSADAQLLEFDKAGTFYKRKDYKQAIELYEKALLTKDPQVEAAGKYNLGNCYFQKALLESETDPKTAIEQLDRGMSYYRDAMETLARPENARYNLEKSKLLKKELIDKAKKQQDEQQKKQDQNKDDKKDQKKDEQKKDDQSKKEDEKKKEEQKAGGDDKKDKNDQQEQQAGKEEQKKEMSPEDAEKLLNAIRERQQQNEREERVRQPAGYAPVDRDW